MITHDSWQKIKEIFQSAQERPPAERSDYLDQACGNDQSIREEVEALLVADASNENFLSVPAYEFAASILAGEETEFSAGQKVGRYTILCPLGSGGMGHIYLAEDEQLGRKIALKLISPQFASDARRVQRFEQEALAASALNHPNICVIHELGITESGRHFIAMEYIQGVTLREQLSRGKLPLRQALNVAVQVAGALASAHASGIIHRDIKPENIMQRPDGYIKVLDFGLAKLTETLPGLKLQDTISTKVHSEIGMLMGTVKYMSPEQLQDTKDIKIDERTDIWSLGVVLYEMVTGESPFKTRTPAETIADVLAPQRARLQYPEGTPKQLQEIVGKALEKERDHRYQTVTKLAADLGKLRARLQRQTESEFDLEVVRRDEQLTRRIDGSGLFTRLKSQALYTTEFILSEIRSHKRTALFAGASVLAFLLLLPSATRWISNFINPPVVQGMKPITNDGTSVCAAISSDGKLIAHAEEKAGKQRLVLTNTETSSSDELIPPMEVQYLGISFTRNSNYLYFTRKENEVGMVYRLPIPGNDPVRVKKDVDSPISLSPQEDRFAFVRLDKAKGFSLRVSNIDGSDASDRVIKVRQDKEGFLVTGLAWSPDGNIVVCPTRSWTDKGYSVDLVAFDVETGDQRTVSTKSWSAILQVAWQADMSRLIISARDKLTGPYQLWEIAYPSGAVRRLTNDLAEYRGVSLAGKNILTVRNEREWELYVAKAANNYEQGSALVKGAGLSYGLTWAGNDRIVYSSMVRDLLNISRINSDGSNRVQLTREAGDNYTPATTSDGKVVVFASGRTGSFNIWRMNAEDGSDLQQLTFSDSNFYPAVSPDNQWVAFDNQQITKLSIWRVPLQGGDATKLVEGYRMPAYSPDSQFIAARYDLDSGTKDVAIFSAEGGQPSKNLEIPILEWQRIQWLSAHTLTYVKRVDGHSEIWSYDLGSGATKKLTSFNRDQIFAYAWSPDQRQLAYQLGISRSNVVLIGSDQ